jgi:Mn-dependent DtxR family transcriptional regulator
MGKPISLYQQYWLDKRFLRMLTTRKECDLSHAQKELLSFLVYKARDKAEVGTNVITKALGLDRRTVWQATKRLIELGLVAKTGQGYEALDPLAVRPEWFAAPHDGGEWWERLRNYRHYLLTASGKRSRGNRAALITEMDNAVLWMLYSLAKGGNEIVGQRVSGLEALLGCSRHTVRDAIRRLAAAGLIMKRSDGFTLLKPNETVRPWWRDRPKKEKSGVTAQAGGAPVIDEADQFGWIGSLISEFYGADTKQNRDFLDCVMRDRTETMIRGRVKPTEAQKYWREVLDSFPDSDKAWEFCNLGFTELWKDAHRTHASHGKYAGSCINLLTANTRTFLLTPWNDPLSLLG